MESYLVPAGYGEAERIEKRSRFIGQVWHAETEEEARTYGATAKLALAAFQAAVTELSAGTATATPRGEVFRPGPPR